MLRKTSGIRVLKAYGFPEAAEKDGSVTSAAKAFNDSEHFPQRRKRCATQKSEFFRRLFPAVP